MSEQKREFSITLSESDLSRLRDALGLYEENGGDADFILDQLPPDPLKDDSSWGRAVVFVKVHGWEPSAARSWSAAFGDVPNGRPVYDPREESTP